MVKSDIDSPAHIEHAMLGRQFEIDLEEFLHRLLTFGIMRVERHLPSPPHCPEPDWEDRHWPQVPAV